MKKTIHIVLAIAVFVSGFSFIPPVPEADAVTQNAYRWRNDDGSETSATWAANENTGITVDKNVTRRLRFGVENDGTESELTRIATSAFPDGAPNFAAATRGGGFLYAVTNDTPASIVKIDESDLSVDGVIHMNNGENYGGVHSLAIDVGGGFLYWGTATSPAKIVKVRLSDFTRVDTLTLNSGENVTGTLLIDTVNGFLYLGTRTSPALVVKVSTSSFTRVGAVTLTGVSILFSGAIDVADQMSYWGSLGTPGRVAQVDLSPFSFVTSIAGDTGENNFRSATYDTTNDFVYFGTGTSPARVVKFNAASFARVGAITLNSGENDAYGAAIDIAESKAFFGVGSNPGQVVEVDLSGFTRTGAASGNSGENEFFDIVIDDADDEIYAFSFDDGVIVEFDYSTTLARSAGADRSSAHGIYTAGAIDEANGFAYYGTYTDMARVHKVRLSDLALVATIEFAPSVFTEGGYITSAAIDTVNGFAYFGNEGYPGQIVKIRLSDFTHVDTLTLSSGNALYSAAMDAANGFAYFTAYDESPAKIAKIDLSDFSEDSILTLNSGENNAYATDIDTVNGDLYVSTNTDPGIIVKIDLGSFTRTGALTLDAGESYLESLVVDDANQFAYAGTFNSNGKIVKVNVSNMTRVGAVTSGTDDFFGQAAIDSAKGFALFPVYAAQGKVVQVDLANFDIENTLTLNANEQYPVSIVAGTRGKAYVATHDSDTAVIEVDFVPNAALRLEYGKKVSTCSAISGWTQVGTGAWQTANSSYLANGAVTTNVGSGVTDGNTNFVASEILDTSSQATRVALSFDDFTEVEYSIKASAAAEDGSTYCFRLTDAGTPTEFTYTNYAEATLAASSGQTVDNAATLSRHKAGESATFALSFELSGTLSTTTTVTFPAGFTVTGAFTSGTCTSGTISNFNFTSSTLTADKSSCTGTVSLSGATVTLPSTPGAYVVSWVNDEPGSTVIPVTDDDQVSVSAQVDETMTFDLDTGTTTGADSSAPYSVALGELSTSSVTSSGDGTVHMIGLDVDTNASAGAVVQVRNANGSSGLVSASAPGDSIDAVSSTTLSPGTEGYGICVYQVAATTGTFRSAGYHAGGTLTASNGTNTSTTCAPGTHQLSTGLSTTFQDILDSDSGGVAGARGEVFVKASVSDATPAHDDYADTLTFRATATF